MPLLLRIALLLLALAHFATLADPFPATFASDVAVPNHSTLMAILQGVCPEGIRTRTDDAGQIFGCGAPLDEIIPLPARGTYAWSDTLEWHADGIVFGHFLSEASDDAVVSGAAHETHPALYGGTLLLTKKDGQWKPLWYKPGVITRRCRRLSLATGRQILFCEETDADAGHAYHLLYTVDLTKPSHPWDNPVFVADSFASAFAGGVQQQSIDRVEFYETSPGETTVRIFARHGRVALAPEEHGRLDPATWPSPRVTAYRIDLRFTGDRFTPSPDTGPAATVFGIK